MRDQTIFALSSGAGKAGIAVIRVSGSEALLTLGRLTGLTSPTTRRAHRVKITKPETMEIIDDGLALYFPAPNSFTGEDVVEFHMHGSRAVLKETSTLLIQDPNIRLAEPGEFTRRAFDNGKLDLTAAEGLADPGRREIYRSIWNIWYATAAQPGYSRRNSATCVLRG